MSKLRATTIVEQNANTLAGIQVDTAVYVGTGVAGIPVIKAGKNPKFYVFSGVQTSAVVNVIIDTVNAAAGDRMTVKLGTGAALPGTSTIQFRNATTDGTVIGTATGAGTENNFNFGFDGTKWN